MNLQELLAGVSVLERTAPMELNISAVRYSSRDVQPGDLFVAISGFVTDGHKYIADAVKRGAAAVLCEKDMPESVPWVKVPSSREALAVLGANWYGHPAKSMKIIGITGTNGKTSVTYLLKELLEKALKVKVGLIGTICNLIGEEVLETERTTPESFELQGLLAQMRDAGCEYVVMEVSSHALALSRVGGMEFSVGAFTNLTEDHLDFHKTMLAYAQAKALLFEKCKEGVFDIDDPWAQTMMETAASTKYTVSTKYAADLRAENALLASDRIEMDVLEGENRAHLTLGIPGRFTVSNALVVLGIARKLGVSLEEAVSALSLAKGVKGRIEVVPTPGKDYTVLIDYAHTPDGLENVLRSVRDFCKGRIITVFGCGGDRDKAKRPLMGEIAARLSDHVIVTSDNPRTEVPMDIIEDILRGIRAGQASVIVEENRRKAIRLALQEAKKDDMIILAGKGHETYQILGAEKLHLDEREEVATALGYGLTLQQAAAFCKGTVEPRFADIRFFGANFDTRRLKEGELFVALQGARDGHDFVPAALEKGAAAVLASKPMGEDIPAIYVEDTTLALQSLAKGYRECLNLTCVGITGSVGKTTTKEMIAAVLEQGYVTQKTAENFNNGIGLPVSVLGLREDCRGAVLEMGMNHFGEIAALTAIAQPDIALITNIGTMHIENLGSREGILQAKLEILQGLRPGGKVIFWGDDEYLSKVAENYGALTYGFGAHNDVRATDLAETQAGLRFTLHAKNRSFPVELPAAGEHNVLNALAAATVGLLCGLEEAQIQKALGNFRNTGMRQNIYTKKGIRIIEDCYNAGPESMAAALEVLKKAPGRKIAALGGMLELGELAPRAHYAVGQKAAELCDALFAYGENSEEYVRGAKDAGLTRAQAFPSHEALAQALKETLQEGDSLLVKGSRGMKMEKVLQLMEE